MCGHARPEAAILSNEALLKIQDEVHRLIEINTSLTQPAFIVAGIVLATVLKPKSGTARMRSDD